MFGGIGPYPLMLIAAAGLLVPLGLTVSGALARERAARRDAAAGQAEQPLGQDATGSSWCSADRYLRLIAVLVLVLNLVNTLGGFMLNTLDQLAVNGVSPTRPGAKGGDS